MSKEQEAVSSRAVGPPDLNINVNECSSVDNSNPFDLDMFDFGISDDIFANIPETSNSTAGADLGGIKRGLRHGQIFEILICLSIETKKSE